MKATGGVRGFYAGSAGEGKPFRAALKGLCGSGEAGVRKLLEQNRKGRRLAGVEYSLVVLHLAQQLKWQRQ